ncbi:MAG: restriction endonuclease, partial [bacterium]
GKAVGTLIEKGFKKHLEENYIIDNGSSAKGIDLPGDDILTDIKVTSISQPQSSCPFRDAKQKIFGLGYNLLVFVYDKKDDANTQTANLDFVSCSYISKNRTADYTTTSILNSMKKVGANIEDIMSFLIGIKIPADEIMIKQIAEQILATEIEIGYLTISNALQWRLQYQRIVNLNDEIQGIDKIVNYNKAV